jgi:hypothetical protein
MQPAGCRFDQAGDYSLLMPNGVDKNLVRLSVACAVYRRMYGEWLTEARLSPLTLWDIARIVDLESFEGLGELLTLKTSRRAQISVGGKAGYVRYEKLSEYPPVHLIDEARAWLGVRLEPGLERH